MGRELVRMGHEVHVVTPKHGDQQRVENLDGMVVHGTSFRETLLSGPILREISADIYLSQEPSLPSYAAQRACPNARHIIVCRDPRGAADILVELRYATMGRRLRFPFQYVYEFQPLVKLAVRRADRVLMPTPTYLRQKIQRLYGMDVEPQFVPSTYLTGQPPALPKASRPTFISVGRWDRRKRMDIFFQLAEQRPNYEFIAVGRAHSQREDRRYRTQYEELPNLHMPGHVDLFSGRLWDYYDTS